MPALSYNCDVYQGFNFKKDKQTTVGHISSLKIGEQQLAADISVTNPEDHAALVPVFGVAASVHWDGGYADPVLFQCNVSNANKNLLSQLVHKALSNTEVKLKFNVYQYDPIVKKYFKAFHTGDVEVTGLVQKHGGELAMQIATDESTEVMSPKNFAFMLGTVPSETEMALHVAVSSSGKMVKKFGVKVGA